MFILAALKDEVKLKKELYISFITIQVFSNISKCAG